MTTPKPVALPELPVVKTVTTERLAEEFAKRLPGSAIDGFYQGARYAEQFYDVENLCRYSDALSAIAMHRAEVERLRLALDEAVRRADEAERAANAEARLADQAAAAMQERCAWACEAVASAHALVRNTTAEHQCAAAIRSLSSTTGATNKD